MTAGLPIFFSAVTGLVVQEYMFKEKLRNCEPIDLAQSFCCGPQSETLGVLDTLF